MSVTTYQEVTLGTFLRQEADTVAIAPDATYTTAGIYSYGRGLFRRPPITGSETNYTKYNRIRKGQFIYSKLFGWEGALATVPEEFDGLYVSHEFPTFHIDDSIADPGYVAHLATWPGLHDKLRDQGTGMGSRRQRVNVDRLISATVPLPDLDEQRRIAARLDAAMAKLSRVEQLQEQRTKLHTAFRESLIAEAANEAPGGVVLGSLLQSVRQAIGINPEAQYKALGMRSFGRGSIRYPAVPGKELSKLRYFSFPSEALVLSNIKAWEGAIGVTDEEDLACVASNRFLFYQSRDERVNIRYLRHYLLSRQGLAQISACSPGSADRNRTLSIKAFERLSVPLPSRTEQDRIARALDSLNVTANPERSREIQSALVPSLLNAAFRGQL